VDLGRLASNRTLLTGAGFSKNFGGYLANEVATQIRFNPRTKDNPDFYHLLKSCNYMYEDALEVAKISKPYAFYRTLEETVIDVYRIQNSRLCQPTNTRSDEWSGGFYNTNKFFQMVGPISQQGGQPTSANIFTLNQDLFVERHIQTDTVYSLPYTLPGVRGQNWFFQPSPEPTTAELNNSVSVDDTDENVERIEWKGRTNYIKLHGSSEWRDASGELLIIGGNKQTRLEKSPLLKAYQEVFKKVLCSGDMKLLVIGYSFSDEHINSIINTAMQDYALKMWVWDYQTWVDWDKSTSDKPFLGKIEGYLNTPFKETFGGTTSGGRFDHADLRAYFS
jgi:hypothetical protein